MYTYFQTGAKPLLPEELVNTKRGITVFCASSQDINPEYITVAHSLGREIARAGLPLITGSGKMGLMRAVNDGAIEAGGVTTGVLPEFMYNNGLNHTSLTNLIVTPDMHRRKETMAALSVGTIALPGGVGTFEELLEIITWRKLSLYNGNVVIFNQNGYYNDLIAMLGKAHKEGFMSYLDCFTEDDSPLWHITDDICHAVQLASTINRSI